MIIKAAMWLRNKCRRRFIVETWIMEYHTIERYWTYESALARYEAFSPISELYVWIGFDWLKLKSNAPIEDWKKK